MNEYTIDANGVTLNGGRTWQDADHLNVRTESGTTNFHAEAKCAALPAPPECSPIMVSAASRIGESFIPWSDLGIDPASCIEWVQFSRANYHFGEAGEDPICLTVVDEEPPAEEEEPPVTEEPPVDTPPILEPPFECPPGKAPGWLDADGNPTSCVDDNPTPGKPKDELPPPVDTPSTEVVVPVSKPEQLAETGGVEPLGMILAAVVLVAGGAALLRKAVAR